MFTLIRRIHLYTGLILLTWILMYFITGLPIIHENWIAKKEPVKTSSTSTYHSQLSPTDPSFWKEIERQFSIAGKRGTPAEKKSGEWQMKWHRPGTEFNAQVIPATRQATVTKTEHGARNVLVGLHRMHGYGGGWIYNIYALFLDLSSIAVILFAFSGIYLWYVTTPNKIPGIICLGISVSFTALMVVHLMTQR